MPLTDLTYQVICSHSISKVETELIIMIPISEQEELAIDKGLLVTTRNGFVLLKKSSPYFSDKDFRSSSEISQ